MYTLNWQPPYDWSWMLGFLAARAVSGVETVAEDYYARSLAVGEYRGSHGYPGESALVGLLGAALGLRRQHPRAGNPQLDRVEAQVFGFLHGFQRRPGFGQPAFQPPITDPNFHSLIPPFADNSQ